MRTTLSVLSTSLLLTLAVTTVAPAHESWISRGALRNPAGEWCCGDGDCFVVPQHNVHANGVGYVLFGKETIPYSQAMPSPDGSYWRCKRPDGSPRCFFAPPPNS
jgi:hypothetical protein